VQQWADDNPYFLIMVALERNPDGSLDTLTLDLGEQGWETTHADWLHRAAEWYLCEKVDPQRAIVGQIVYEGEHPYYVKRHIGQMELNTGRHRALVAHGIGKKVPAAYETYMEHDARGEEVVRRRKIRDKRTDRLWILPHGLICGGEDIEKMALAVVSTMEWQEPAPEPVAEVDPVREPVAGLAQD